MAADKPNPTCWILTEGIAGTENQCLALAAALGLKCDVKRAAGKLPWRLLGPEMASLPLSLIARGRNQLTPPWPDLLIASGHKCAGLALTVRRASRGKSFTVFVQNPRLGFKHFDLIIAPRHDGVTGSNTFGTRGALSRVTNPLLNEAAETFAPKFAHLPRPLVACLIGGSSRRHTFRPTDGHTLGKALARLSEDTGCGLLITTSRRTPKASFTAFEAALGHAPMHIWRGAGTNPYLGYLALADHMLVTADSVSMISDACNTGKPVHILPMDGHSSARFDQFFAALEAEGVVRPFTGTLDSWTYEALNDCSKAAAYIRQRLTIKTAQQNE